MGQSHAVFQDNSILLFVNSQYSLYVGWNLSFKLCIKISVFLIEDQILEWFQIKGFRNQEWVIMVRVQ